MSTSNAPESPLVLDPRGLPALTANDLRRRVVLHGALVGAASLALGACSDDAEIEGTGATGSGTTSGQGGASSSATGAGGGTTGSTTTTGSGGAGGGGDLCEAFDPSCEETPDNPLGPYYRAGAPNRAVLDNPSGLGERLKISGRVYAADCVTPLAGAVVEVWQADSEGNYDNEAGDPGPDVWVLRGQVVADACGNYAFESVLPGRYLNGNQYRPVHIHYRVTHPDTAPYVTQLYFEGDPYNALDSMFLPELAIPLEASRDGGGAFQAGTFDIVLAP